MMEPTRFQFYGRRHGRPLRPVRHQLLAGLLPKMLLALDGSPVNCNALFQNSPHELWLEIGFGAGEHLAALVDDNPDIGFIGCEPFINGVASLLSKVGTLTPLSGPANLKIFPDDARLLLPLLPAASFDRIYAMFPDPWPKARHNRRRLISPETLDELARLLRPGGLFRMASDHMEYIRWTMCHFQRHPSFEWQAQGPTDWRERYSDSVPTRYETKALSKGASCVYLTFRRLP
jgi:tRNA (guanine-N7-)-methyltransferase